MSKSEQLHNRDQDIDIEKNDVSGSQTSCIEVGELAPLSLWNRIMLSGMELRGVEPVPIEERNDKRGLNIFTMWWSISLTLLA